MNIQYNVNDRKMIKILTNSKRFQKYPDLFLSDQCKVIVNNDDYLKEDEFIIKTKSKVLPRSIMIYGKKRPIRENDENIIYLNYWMEVFLKTIENGILTKCNFEKSNSKIDLCIGLPFHFRVTACNRYTWERKDIIKFLNCLFDIEIYEADYEQQDLFAELLAA